MPYVPGHEEDGFLKKLDISPADIEPKANRCTQVRIHLISERVPLFLLTNYNNEIRIMWRDRENTTDLRLAHADQIQYTSQ